ncbi:MAG: hypothetical protein A2539_00765 [Elusimicrobia bacterium RIFOXYD2_FULL_34_15]|nr:MAG: hypothetical protein A2539_00765 [Elusimicrobia bacterium RIFOXYD2_FULL_34_15]HAM38454.1 hypothetical protein [Elusimicrobiota bacterium]
MAKQNSVMKSSATIPEGWEETSLKEVAETISQTYSFSDKKEIIFINTGDIQSGNFLHKNYSKVDTLPGQAKKMIKRNDILFSEIRPKNQRYAFVNFANTEDYVVSTKLMVIRAKNNILPEYLYRILINKNTLDEFQQLAESRSGTFPQITFDSIKEHPILLPSLSEQRAIAKILSDLDEKIELNNQMNKTLESIAQAIFKEWFVDFRFPGYKKTKFVNGLPDGWRMSDFGEIAKIQPGFAFKSSDFTTQGYKIIKIANIQNGIVDISQTDYVSEDVFGNTDKRFHLVSGDVIIAMTGANIGKIGIIPKIEKSLLLNQRVGKLVSKYHLWAYLVLTGPVVQSLIEGISSSSSAQPNISNTDIEKTKVVIPNETILEMFEKNLNSIYKNIIENLATQSILSQIRDSLLPKLMSGKIRVK